MVLLRTLLFVPGSRPNMIERARSLQPDAVVFDLEDSVSLDEKERARAQVREAIPSFATGGRGVWVRINSTYTGMAKDDVRAVLAPGLDGILLPKADSPTIVRYTEGLLRDQESRAGIEQGQTRMIAIVETAAALLHVEEIGRSSPRLVALAFGAEDYTADMDIERTAGGEELQYARHMIAIAARAAGLQALDTVYPFLHDLDALTRETELARRAGFKGKLLIHPEQIDPVARVFAPSPDAIAHAQRVVEAYRQATTASQGAVQVDGQMVDAPVAKRAQALLDAVTPEKLDGIPGPPAAEPPLPGSGARPER